MNAIEESLARHRQEKVMIEKRVAGDQQRLRELEAIIAALEAIPKTEAAAPAEAQPTTRS